MNRRLARASPETSRDILSRASARSPSSLPRSPAPVRLSLLHSSAAPSRAEQGASPETCAVNHAEHIIAHSPPPLLEDTDAASASHSAQPIGLAAKAAVSLTPILAAAATRDAESRPSASRSNAVPLDEEARKKLQSAKAKERARLRTERYHFTKPHADFAEWCDKKMGGLACVWRKVDDDGNMCLTKAEFLKGYKALHYPAPFNELWAALDRDKMGTVSFIEFDPEGALMLARFKHWLEVTFGGVTAAFQKFDTARNGLVDIKEFLTGCLKEEIPSDVCDSLRDVFKILDNSANRESRGNITVEEMHFLVAWKCPAYLWADPDAEAMEQFKAALAAKYHHNVLLSWRKALDRDGSMKVTYDEFVASCKVLARQGVASAAPASGVPALYCTLDTDRSGWFTFRDWDYDSFKMLVKFTRWTKAEFGKPSNCVRAWEKEKGVGVSLGGFRRHAASLGLPDPVVNQLFEALSLEKVEFESSRGKIVRNELIFLDAWESSADHGRKERRASFRSMETQSLLGTEWIQVEEVAEAASKADA